MQTTRRPWTREETLVAFNVYCRTPFGRLHARNPEIIDVAAALSRTPSSLAMKCCNLAAFDPALQSRGVHGLRKASELDAEIWKQFAENPETIAVESEQCFSLVMNQEPRLAAVVEWEEFQGLDKAAVTKVRINQQFFRSIVLAGYQSKCAVCALPFPRLLVAAHIVPWSIDKSLRMNPHNGICFCTLHDKAFDTGLLGIAADYTLSVHADVAATSGIDSVDMNFTRFAGRKITLPDRWHPDPALLSRHAELLC